MKTLQFTWSWEFPDRKSAVLTFNEAAWKAMQPAAKREGLDADQLISVTVAGLVRRIGHYRVRQ